MELQEQNGITQTDQFSLENSKELTANISPEIQVNGLCQTNDVLCALNSSTLEIDP